MIRINLLPREEIPAQKKVGLPAVGNLAPVVMMLAVVAVLAGVAFMQDKKVNELEKVIAQEEAESRRLAPEIAKIKRLNQQRQELNERLDVITSLDRDRYFRVHLMDELNRSLPEHLWLTRFEDVGGDRYAIEGVTFSNFLVSDLMQNLNRSPYFASVDLMVAERGEISQVKVVKFKAQTTAVRAPRPMPFGS
jgi:type IV pilus assembly protein PilN